MQLSDLGDRICILGPSNSGKSTLAAAIGVRLGVPVVHLDRLYHLPQTDWVPRSAGEFLALHDAAIAGDRWVMDGNYSVAMPQRFAAQPASSFWTSRRCAAFSGISAAAFFNPIAWAVSMAGATASNGQ